MRQGRGSTHRQDNHGTLILTKIYFLTHMSPKDTVTELWFRRWDSSGLPDMQHTFLTSSRRSQMNTYPWDTQLLTQ